MLIEYFKSNVMSLMLVFTLIVLMIVNRKTKLPAAGLFKAGIVILLMIILVDLLQWLTETWSDLTAARTVRILADTANYIIRPVLILIELYIILPDKKHRLFYALPAVINAAIYSSTLFGLNLGFYIDEHSNWHEGPLYYTIFVVQVLYLCLLLWYSGAYFKQKNINKSLIIFTMILQAVIASLLEIFDFPVSFTNAITALCMLEYYIYLITVYQQEMSDSLLLKELEISEAEMQILRNQIQPHFIYNTLTIIRSLVRTDSTKAIHAINTFSKYLRTHISTIQSDDMISFEDELKNVEIYMELAQADYPGKIEIIRDLRVTEFRIPPLSLEPIVENAIQHGISRNGGKITISTCMENEHIVIKVSDDGTAKKELTKKAVERTGVGLKNTEKRLELQCNGTMETDLRDSGCVVTMRIPKKGGEL